jgi:hypothetical protein
VYAAEREPPARPARAGEKAGDGDLALDAPRDAVVLGRGEVPEHGSEPRRPTLYLEVAQVPVAELPERPVANVQRAAGKAPAARDREVPGQVEVAAPDAGPLERAEDLPEVRPARLDQPPARPDPVAVEAESPARPQRPSAPVPEVAQSDDVALALGEVPAGPDDQHTVAGAVRIRVDLRPDGVAPAGAGVDDDDR